MAGNVNSLIHGCTLLLIPLNGHSKNFYERICMLLPCPFQNFIFIIAYDSAVRDRKRKTYIIFTASIKWFSIKSKAGESKY
jgi:hypothetical protein